MYRLGLYGLNFPQEVALGPLLCLHVGQEETREEWGLKAVSSQI